MGRLKTTPANGPGRRAGASETPKKVAWRGGGALSKGLPARLGSVAARRQDSVLSGSPLPLTGLINRTYRRNSLSHGPSGQSSNRRKPSLPTLERP